MTPWSRWVGSNCGTRDRSEQSPYVSPGRETKGRASELGRNISPGRKGTSSTFEIIRSTPTGMYPEGDRHVSRSIDLGAERLDPKEGALRVTNSAPGGRNVDAGSDRASRTQARRAEAWSVRHAAMRRSNRIRRGSQGQRMNRAGQRMSALPHRDLARSGEATGGRSRMRSGSEARGEPIPTFP